MVDKRLVGATSGATKDMSLRHPKGKDGLTDRQRIFVKIYTDNEGRLTPTECARQAGYKEERAAVTSSELLNGKQHPKVVEAVLARRAELEKTHEVKLSKHVQELARLREIVLCRKSLIVLLLMLSACEGRLRDCTLTVKKSEQVQY